MISAILFLSLLIQSTIAWYAVPSAYKNNYYAPEFRVTPFSINLQDNSVYSFSYEKSASSSHPTQLPLVVCVTFLMQFLRLRLCMRRV